MPVNLQQILGDQHNIKTIQMNGLRWYYDTSDPDPVYRVSMTSALGKAYAKTMHFFDWAAKTGKLYSIIIRETAACFGVVAHDAIDMLNQGHSIDKVWIEIALFEYKNDLWKTENTLKRAVYKVQKFLESYMAWHDEYQPQILASEFPLYHPEHIFAGRTDQMYKIDLGKEKNCLVLVDNKTGMPHDHHMIQCMGYAYIYNNFYRGRRKKINKVATLYLKDGFIKKPGFSFKVQNYDETRYLNFCDYYVGEYGVPEIKFGYLPRSEFSLTNKDKGNTNGSK